MPRIIDGSTMNMTGQKIKQYRKERKMSQQQLSIKLETLAVYICRGSISRIEQIFFINGYIRTLFNTLN